MIGLEFTCDTCGARFKVPNLIGGTGSTFMSGNRVGCPVQGCSGWGHHEAGTYDFVDSVVKAFTAPGMTREQATAFQSIVQQVQAGKLASNEARDEIAAQSSSLAKVWDWVGDNDKQLMILLTIIGLFLAHYHFRNANADVQADLEVRHSAVQADLKNAEAELRNAKALEKIGGELQRMNIDPPKMAQPLPSKQRSQTRLQAQTTAPKNRAERRKQVAIERRRKKQDQ